MAQHGGRREGDLALDHVQVGVADTARRDADEHLAACAARDRDLLQAQRRPRHSGAPPPASSRSSARSASLDALFCMVEHVRAMVY